MQEPEHIPEAWTTKKNLKHLWKEYCNIQKEDLKKWYTWCERIE